MEIVIDIECDSLDPTVIWCVVCKDASKNVFYTFEESTKEDLIALLARSSKIIGHNIIDYDLPALSKLWGVKVPHHKVIDTLILSRLHDYKIEEGHSLEAWGAKLGFPKVEFNDFSKYTPEMLRYCIGDVKLSSKLFHHLTDKIDINSSYVRVEHDVAEVCRRMHISGFPFDKVKAEKVYEEVSRQVTDLNLSLQQAFPPKSKLIREIKPSLTKHGTISRSSIPRSFGRDLSVFVPYEEDGTGSFSYASFEPFNPGSPKQIVGRLALWWDPVERTSGYVDALRERDEEKLRRLSDVGWKINESNLATIRDGSPEACRSLVKYLLLKSRLTTLESWFEAYNKDSMCLHGKFASIGTWTHRMSHREPNLGNIAAKKSIKYKTPELASLAENLGAEMRSLFHAGEEGTWLVGTDADGIQLRILAHYMDDKEFTYALTQGDSKKGTDAHTLNMKALGITNRDTAKTFIYAWLLGAGLAKVSQILGMSIDEARIAVERFINKYPGLRKLKEEIIPYDAHRGYFVGIDGRRVMCDSQHLMLAGYLQNGEAVVMKHALLAWMEQANRQRLRYVLRNFVHDEWQTSSFGDEEQAHLLGRLQSKSIEDVGIKLKLKCPLKGNYKVGKTWLDTH